METKMAEKEPKHVKMYKNSPTLETDGDGKKYIKKGPTEAEKKTSEQSSGTDGIEQHEGMPIDVRHAHERRDMHSRHETEHMMTKGEKAEMHSRHQSDMKALHKKHEKEGSTGGKEIARVKNDEKA